MKLTIHAEAYWVRENEGHQTLMISHQTLRIAGLLGEISSRGDMWEWEVWNNSQLGNGLAPSEATAKAEAEEFIRRAIGHHDIQVEL